jgi:hypothetical protein
MEYIDDILITDSIKLAVGGWIDGTGSVTNFVNVIYKEAKSYFSTANSEWRGAVVIYLVAGSGIKLPVELKLIMLDCLNSWEMRVNKDLKADPVEKVKILTEVAEFREYALKYWGGSYQWCRNIISNIIVSCVIDKFWKTTETESAVNVR